MVLNQLKKIRNELRNSAETYDAAFKNVAVIAAEELVQSEQNLKQQLNNQTQPCLDSASDKLDKEYFLDRYGSLKNAKAAYKEVYGKQNYGRSWSDFIAVANQLGSPKPRMLTLEERITKMEKFLCTLGYQL